jgi:hypothetical protein
VLPTTTNVCGIDGNNCGNQAISTYYGVSFTRDGSIAAGAFVSISPDSQYSTFDDLPSTGTTGLTTPAFSLAFSGIPQSDIFTRATGFAYESNTSLATAAAIFNGFNAGEVYVGSWSNNSGFGRTIGSQYNAAAQLDSKIGGIAIGGDGTIYVASATGYVNVFAPG